MGRSLEYIANSMALEIFATARSEGYEPSEDSSLQFRDYMGDLEFEIRRWLLEHMRAEAE